MFRPAHSATRLSAVMAAAVALDCSPAREGRVAEANLERRPKVADADSSHALGARRLRAARNDKMLRAPEELFRSL